MIEKLLNYFGYYKKPKTLREKAKEYKRQTGYDIATPEERKILANSFIENMAPTKIENCILIKKMDGAKPDSDKDKCVGFAKSEQMMNRAKYARIVS